MLCLGCPVIIPGREDHSDFEVFRFRLEPGLGFCPEDDVVFTGELRKEPDGAYRLEMSILEKLGVWGVDDCAEEYAWDCLVLRELPARYLSADETEELLEIFRSVTVETVLYFPMCIEWCVFHLAQWDDRELSANKGCWGFVPYQVLSDAQMAEIIAFLEQLRAASEP